MYIVRLLCLSIIVGWAVQAQALDVRRRATGHVSFYVAPDGSDANDCLSQSTPCKTAQIACTKAMNEWDFGGYDPFIRLSAGIYNGGCNLAGQLVGAHTINIVGEQSEDQSCTLQQAERVIVHPAPGTSEIFMFQDLAIGVLRCLTVEGPGAHGVKCRQTPASDIAFVKFGGSQGLQFGASAGGSCGLNLGGTIWVGNNLTAVVAAGSNSRLTAAAHVVATNPVSLEYFALSYDLSLIEFFYPITGPFTVQNGSRVWRAGTILTNGQSIPGGCVQADANQPGHCW
jgi:hypothetical protein